MSASQMVVDAKRLQGKHLHFDCVSGIAGDMTLGAMIDLGVPAQVIRDAIEAVGLGSDRLQVSSCVKSGIAAMKASVRCDTEGQTLQSVHAHSDFGHADRQLDTQHDEHLHYHYAQIRGSIEASSLATEVKSLSLRIFDRIAEAEAKLHGTSVAEVAFHEVGAIDSIVDVIGSAAAFVWLSPSSTSSSPVAMGSGTLRCAHGILPVPSPAALEIMRAVAAPVADGGIAMELCTPTGAAIVATLVGQWGGMPVLTPIAIGYGAGDFDLPDRPNVLRLTLGETAGPAAFSGIGTDCVYELEANIDDMNSELCEHIAESLFEIGAVDVWWTPITMKKGRPALALRVLCSESQVEIAMERILRESSTIGVRFRRSQRCVLDRETCQVETEYGVIPVKISRWRGEIVNAAPEYEACRKRALAQGVALKRVFAAAASAWHVREGGIKSA